MAKAPSASATRHVSIGITLKLEDTVTKEVHTRVVAQNQIEWLEAKDF